MLRWWSASAFTIALGCSASDGDPIADADSGTGDGDTTAVATSGSTGADGSSGAESETTAAPVEYPDPGDGPPNDGPGGPNVAFDAADLYQTCAFLNGGEDDFDHHNLVAMFNGYLLLPWAPEFGWGGMSFFDVSDPCQPSEVAIVESLGLRETHAIGFTSLDDRYFAVTAYKHPMGPMGGVQIWDVTDASAAGVVAEIELPGHGYPDAYARVTLSAFWEAPYIYVAGSDNGIWVVDAHDPEAPVHLSTYEFEPTLRAGQLQVIGSMLVVSAAEGPRTALLDVSNPETLQPIAGGDFDIVDQLDVVREAYFANVGGGYVYYAIKNNLGGLLVYDIRDPSAPAFAGNRDTGGNGGYVFVKDELAFVGESNFAAIYDVADPAAIVEVAQLNLVGDLDTMTPVGNVAVLSVDDEADPDQATAIAPYATDVDTRPPTVTWSVPADGAQGVALTSPVGVTMSEMADVKSAWEGSVRLYRSDVEPAVGRVDGYISVQENIVNFVPVEPLEPGTTYTFEIPAGGVADYNGNRVAEGFSISFTTTGA